MSFDNIYCLLFSRFILMIFDFVLCCDVLCCAGYSLLVACEQSAKALHGRMQPLKGASYSNMFTHYRPAGDPKWSTRPNPENTPAQVLSIDHCKKVDGVLDCDGVKLPFLSPSKEVVKGRHDLFNYWERITETIKKSPRVGEL
jgi:hypothetical protein